MLIEDLDNVDEQIQKLERLCIEAYAEYKLYSDEYDAEMKEGVEIHQDLIDRLNASREAHKTALYNWHSFQRFCYISKIDLTKHWIRLGFTQKQIQEYSKHYNCSKLKLN